MSTGEFSRRAWAITAVRIAVALATTGAIAVAFHASSVGAEARMGVTHPHGLGASMVFVGLGPLLWLAPVGFLVDHVFRHRSWQLTLGAHLIGIYGGYIASQMILGADYITFGPPVGEPFARYGVFSIAIGTMIAFLFAGFVPGSFPQSSHGRRVADPVLSGSRSDVVS